jgi:hypothetical protein
MFDTDMFDGDSSFTAGMTGRTRECRTKADLAEWFMGFSVACMLNVPADETPNGNELARVA